MVRLNALIFMISIIASTLFVIIVIYYTFYNNFIKYWIRSEDMWSTALVNGWERKMLGIKWMRSGLEKRRICGELQEKMRHICEILVEGLLI